MLRQHPAAAATAAATVALCVYAATMFPGLVGIGDTPKFQFVGSVLGTPHSPGYPLYMLISWAFAHVPIGTLAFRMNLLSVLGGAVAVGLFALILVELGCGGVVAFAAALAVGLGRVFWSQALLAEVYTLNAALFAATLLFLLRWSRTRRSSDLLRASAFVALGAAHHLTLIMTAPFLAAYVLLTDRAAVRARTIAAIALISCAGLSLYALIWIRTAQHAPFLEVRASSVADLIAIVSGRQFHSHLFAFSWRDLLRERVPVIARWLGGELRWPGIALLAVGAVALSRSRWRELVLLLGSAAAVLLFAVNYDVYDIQVFLILPMIALGLIAGVGLQRAVDLTRPAISRPAAYGGVLCLTLLMPVGQYRANLAADNEHRHTFEREYFDALIAALPPRSAIVAESYPIDHMVLYKLVGEHAAAVRDLELIEADAASVNAAVADGREVYAFEKSRHLLEGCGIAFTMSDLALPGPHRTRHIVDTEAESIAFPLSRVVAPQVSPEAPPGDPLGSAAAHVEPSTGAVWIGPVAVRVGVPR